MGDERRRKSGLRAGHVESCEAMRKTSVFWFQPVLPVLSFVMSA